MTNSHAQLLADLLAFVHDEQAAVQQHLHDIWKRPIVDKLRSGWSQNFTHLERGDDGCLRARPGEAESRFREGDLLMLHTGNPLADGVLGRGFTFEMEDDQRWLLRGQRTHEVLGLWQGGALYADPDTIDLTPLYRQAIEDIRTSPVGRDVLLPLLAGHLPITFDERDRMQAEATAHREGLNAMQAHAVGLACGAEQVACIQGPPGTGKTRVLALAVRLMVERGERVLLTSHTHMAINHALNQVHAQGVPVVKVGRFTQRRGLHEAVVCHDTLGEWDARPNEGFINGYVVGATPFATGTRRLEGWDFDTIVFDEASQVTMPLALMAMRKGRRYIFVGDQAQLPPVLLSRSVLADDVPPSMFAKLTSRNHDHTVMLTDTYRMNQWLTAWPSRAYYGGRLVAAGANRERRLSLVPSPALCARERAPAVDVAQAGAWGAAQGHARWAPEDLAAVLDPDASGVFVPTLDTNARTRNQRDAELVGALCDAAVDGGLALEQIGVVTPYRAQGRAIRTLLARTFGREAARVVVADTVERMQGQERELIVLSLATGDEMFLGHVAAFFFQPERLNVSITRAKTKLIVIGPWLSAAPDAEQPRLRAWVAQYVDLLAHLKRVDLPMPYRREQPL